MRQFVPICPFVLENKTASKIYYSYCGVDKYYPLHAHDYYELELIIEGNGKQWINNVCAPIEKGSLYLLTPSDVHRIEAIEPLKIISVHFLPILVQQMGFPQLDASYSALLHEKDYDFFYHLAFSVLNEKRHALQPYSIQKMQSVTTLMLIYLFRHGVKNFQSTSINHLQKAIHYIAVNYNDPALRLKDVAQVCNLSSCYFSTVFRDMVGCNFSEYLLNYRLHQACILLSDLKISVSEVAYEVGFESLSHFFRVFRQAYHCTPRQFRQKTRALHGLPCSETEHPHWKASITPATSYM